MYLVLGLAFLAAGIGMLVSPQTFYIIMESWKNNAAQEPSDLYRLNVRIGGGFVTLVGIGAIALQFWL